MTTWTSDELDKIAAEEELQIASIQRDGMMRKPMPIWIVRHGDHLYVRSVNGRTFTWFLGTQCRHHGSGPAASRKTSPSWTPRPTSTTRLTQNIAPSTVSTTQASSKAS